MTSEVVRGGLGWERHKAQRDEMRLCYWAKLVRMSEERIAKVIEKTSNARLEQEERKESSRQRHAGTQEICCRGRTSEKHGAQKV